MREALLFWLDSLLREHAEWVILGLVLLVLSLSIGLWSEKGKAARRVRLHHARGKKAEQDAVRLLEKRGFRILSEQHTGSYVLSVDGERVPVQVFADFLVEKGGRSFVAEVKSGQESAKLTRSTRRQLLEYFFAFDVEGVLLVDMHARRILHVSFPRMGIFKRRPS